MARSRIDIQPAALPDLKWDPANVLTSIKKLIAYANAHVDDAVRWYLQAKDAKRIFARSLRLGAILFTAAAGVLPVIIQILQTTDGKPIIAPGWASVLLAIALLFIAIDRFFGFSTAWMRYISAELQLKQLKESFELDSEALLASLQGQPPTPDQVQTVLAAVKAFIEKVNAVVAAETAQWVDEFREALKQIDEGARTQVAIAQVGSVQVVVANGDKTDSGWSVTVDGGLPTRHTGKTAAIAGLLPGDHAVRVIATMAGKPARAESIASVKQGVTTSIEMSLD
jgi:hypothetical protein